MSTTRLRRRAPCLKKTVSSTAGSADKGTRSCSRCQTRSCCCPGTCSAGCDPASPAACCSCSCCPDRARRVPPSARSAPSLTALGRPHPANRRRVGRAATGATRMARTPTRESDGQAASALETRDESRASRSVTTLVTTSNASITSNTSTNPHDLDDLDARGSIYAGRSRLRALWTVWSVEVRVFSGALGKAR